MLELVALVVPSESSLVILAVAAITAIGSLTTVVTTAYFARRAQRATEQANANALKAQEDAKQAQAQRERDAIKAQEGLAQANASAAKAAAALIEAARGVAAATSRTGEQLTSIHDDVKATHTIVNSQKTTMLRTLASQARVIANLLPNDKAAAEAASAAEAEWQAALQQQEALGQTVQSEQAGSPLPDHHPPLA